VFRLEIDDIISVLQQNRLLLHVLLKEDCVKKCMEYGVEGSRPRGRPKDLDCQAHKLNKEDI